MAGTGTKKTSGISTSTILYGWDSIYSWENFTVVAKSGQSQIYASPYWYQEIFGKGNNTFYVGGFYSSDRDDYPSKVNAAYTASFINGGTGSNWISFAQFTQLNSAASYTNRNIVPENKIRNAPDTIGNDFRDLGATTNAQADYYLPSSLVTGANNVAAIYGAPGVIVNLSDKSLGEVLNPLIRPEGKTNEFGLSSGLSDYLSARLLASQAVWGGDMTTNLFGEYVIPGEQTLAGGLNARSYAFFTRENNPTYAAGRVVNIQNIQGSNDASNVLVGGSANGILQGGLLADIIIGGSGNSVQYGMGGNDLLISTTGNDTMYAGQFGRLGKTTPKAALVVGASESLDPGTANATTFVAGTGVVTMVGSDIGNDYFIIGKANNLVYGSGLGASGLGDPGTLGTPINAADFDTLSLNQIGTTYYKGFKNLTVMVSFTDTFRESGTAVGSYEKADGSIATLFNTRFFDIEKIVFGSTLTLFRDPNGFFYPDDPLEPGFTGGDPGELNNQSGLIDPGPSTSTVTGLNPGGGNTINAGGGGNTNFNGGGGPNPNTLNFTSTSGGTFYPCEDQSGGVGNVKNFSLVLHLGDERYTYQQNIDGTPKVFGGSVSNFQNVTGTVCCSDIIAGKEDTISLTGGGGIYNILFGGGKGQADVSQLALRTLSTASKTATELTASHVTTTANGGSGYNWVVFQDPIDLLGGLTNGSGKGQLAYRSESSGVVANLVSDTYSFYLVGDLYEGVMRGFANILGTAGSDTLTGDANRNVLVGADGNDVIIGGGGSDDSDGSNSYGDDILFGGAGVNRVTGSLGKETFIVGYDFNSVAASAYTNAGDYDVDLSSPAKSTKLNADGNRSIKINGDGREVQIITTSELAKDHIVGWNEGTTNLDSLYVSSSGTAIIEGFSGNNSPLTLDFRDAQNLGLISVEVGNGHNTIYGSTSAFREGLDRDGGNDFIKVGNGNNVIDSGDGDDTIIVGNGNNTITVGEGSGKKIYTGGGYNTVNLGEGDDTVYISRLTTKNDITNFTSGKDKITLDLSMLAAVGITDTVHRQIDPITNDAYTPRIWDSQDYKSGVFIGAPLFDVVYRARVDDSYDNGAAGNTDHYAAYVAGISAEVGLQIGLFATAYALWGIPIVGPIIGSIFVGLGLGVFADQATAQQHKNPVYNTNAFDLGTGVDDYNLFVGDKQKDNPIIGLSNVMMTNMLPTYATAADASWASTPFMSFYKYSSAGGFVPSLEVIADYREGSSGTAKFWVNQSRFTTADADGKNGVSGIHTVALLYSGGKTFIYLINSPDALIQSNEAKLIARVNGYIKAEDIETFDAANDSNLGGAPTFSLPPAISGFEYIAAEEGKGLTAGVNGAVTNSGSVTVIVKFATSLKSSDVVMLSTASGQQVGSILTGLTNSSATFKITDLVDGGNVYIATVTSADGFDNTKSFILSVDTVAPLNTAGVGDEPGKNPVGVTASSLGITVSADEVAKFALYSGNTLVSLDTSPPSMSSGLVTLGNDPTKPNYLKATVLPADQNSFTWLNSVRFTDFAGNASTVVFGTQPDDLNQLPFIGLGTIGNDTVNVNIDPIIFDKLNNNAVVYGFGGSDSISASSSITSLTTFIGGNDVSNTIAANANGGNLIVDLSGSSGYLDKVTVAEGTKFRSVVDENPASAALTISGFSKVPTNQDWLLFESDTDLGDTVKTSLLADDTNPADGILISDGKVTFDSTYWEPGVQPSLQDYIIEIGKLLESSSVGTTAVFAWNYSEKVYSSSGSFPTDGIGKYDLVNKKDLYVVHLDVAAGSSSEYSVINLAGMGDALGVALVGVPDDYFGISLLS